MSKATDSASISTTLLQEVALFDTDDSVLVFSAESVPLLRSLARTVAQVDVYELQHSYIDKLPNMQKVTVHTEVFPPVEDKFDKIIIFVPKGRDFARALLWQASQVLAPGGTVYIAGPTNGGAKTVLKDAADLFKDVTTLVFKKRHRVGSARHASASVYPAEWGEEPTQIQFRTLETPIKPLVVATIPGIFSWEHLDEGTRFLLETIDMETLLADKTVLDVGCGTGVIGALAAGYAQHVTLVDDNLLAVRCTQATLAHHHITNAAVLASDVYSALSDERFDIILSNPPFHEKFDINANVAHRILKEAKAHLTKRGSVIWVANSFLRYEDVAAEHFRSVEVLAQNGKFTVVQATQPL
ncbi:class I SAM-dependent methyltransferase [Phototrophicus methaneseepsis]|uniref:Class I SAM-dependent methyltransferase n=1 Tax=Phototrophicus methaneseepsis TaxID=2710758 RepID=A0A7S8E6Z6_9CHLR|nr:methyltransferase [Phototrophicus methaneseepsis]QPC81531.1 class I SAM-dependent methyltransferase [Phototrophicus methaneseepsis]